MTIEVDLLHRVEDLERRLTAHCDQHPLDHHDHLVDEEEVRAIVADLLPGDKRKEERRKGERRTSTETYEGEERRSA